MPSRHGVDEPGTAGSERVGHLLNDVGSRAGSWSLAEIERFVFRSRECRRSLPGKSLEWEKFGVAKAENRGR